MYLSVVALMLVSAAAFAVNSLAAPPIDNTRRPIFREADHEVSVATKESAGQQAVGGETGATHGSVMASDKLMREFA